MDAAQNILVVFEINLRVQPAEVQQGKWAATTGQLLDKKISHLAMPTKKPLGGFYRSRGCPDHAVNHKSVTQFFFRNKRATVHLEYDYRVDRLSIRWMNCSQPISQNAAILLRLSDPNPGLSPHREAPSGCSRRGHHQHGNSVLIPFASRRCNQNWHFNALAPQQKGCHLETHQETVPSYLW